MTSAIPWNVETELHRGPDRSAAARDDDVRMASMTIVRGSFAELVDVVSKTPWKEQPLFALTMPNGSSIYGPQIAALAKRTDYPGAEPAEPSADD